MLQVGFKKNLLFLLLSIAYLLFLIYIGEINLVYSLLYFVIYIVYMVVVIYMDNREQSGKDTLATRTTKNNT